MRYTYIELNLFRRLALNGIEHFAMTITEALQLILGTNGSGKSSILNELTPLPADPASYQKGGSKIIKITHNHKNYVLTSLFEDRGQKHSFFIEGDGEKNDGGTSTVQKDLVWQHFKIDARRQEVIIGRDLFTRMGPGRRKELFIELCDTSYDYALKVYNKLKEMHRDSTGAIKRAKRNLVEESEKLIHSDEEAALLKETKVLHELLNQLLEHRKPVEKDPDNLAIQQTQMDDELMRCAKALESVWVKGQDDTRTVEALEEAITRANDDRVVFRTRMSQHSETFMSNERKIAALKKAEQQTIESLQIDIAKVNNTLQTLKQTNLLSVNLDKPLAAFDAFSGVKATLLEIFSAIPPNEDRRYSSQALAEQRQKLADAQLLKANLVERIQGWSHRRKHMEAHRDKPDVTCPSCHHSFSLNYNQQEFEQFGQLIQDAQKRLEDEVKPLIEKIEEYLKSCGEYAQLYRQYMQNVQGWPVLQPYWDYLAEHKVVTDQPSTGLYHLNLIEQDLQNQLVQDDYRKTIADKENILLSLKDVGGADLKTLVAENEVLGEQIQQETISLQEATNALNQAQASKARLETIVALSGRLQSFVQKKRSINKEQIEMARRHHYNSAVRQLQSALAEREHVLNNSAQQKRIVAHINQEIIDLQEEEQALAVLTKQMSPTEGLIAEGLLSFINSFLAEMNQFIKKIWSYPLVIQPCHVVEGEGVDLDYKFPMMVNNNTPVVSDVSRGSEGMMEIVNLAFRLISMKYMGLQDSPLILDEWGKTFDETHRAQATLAIRTLVEQHSFSQVFMVSHYAASYGALANAEICVLDAQNITVPKLRHENNKHVVMTGKKRAA